MFMQFQSPQWGSNSKVDSNLNCKCLDRFSPRNGEVILKVAFVVSHWEPQSFSPRNGEVILKVARRISKCGYDVSVPAMGK